MGEARDQRRVVIDALQNAYAGTNSWEIILPRPLQGAMGFLIERPLYDYLMNPEADGLPRGSAAFCVFHKHYRPPEVKQRLWQTDKEKFSAYLGDDQNAFLRPVEQRIGGKARILYARGMEVGCSNLLDGLGYEVKPLTGAGRKQVGIDIIAVRSDPEGELDDQVVAVECKTTTQGFEKKARRVFFNSINSSLKKARDREAVRKVHSAIDKQGDAFDYLVATNREFLLPDFMANEGFFIMRGIEVE